MAGGRPTVMTKEVVAKLEDAFSKGCTIVEACFLSDISKDAYYDYIKARPEFSDRVEALRAKTAIHAKINLHTSIMSGDVNDAKWYLERKCKDEFSTKTESENIHSFKEMPKVVLNDGKEVIFQVGEDAS